MEYLLEWLVTNLAWTIFIYVCSWLYNTLTTDKGYNVNNYIAMFLSCIPFSLGLFAGLDSYQNPPTEFEGDLIYMSFLNVLLVAMVCLLVLGQIVKYSGKLFGNEVGSNVNIKDIYHNINEICAITFFIPFLFLIYLDIFLHIFGYK